MAAFQKSLLLKMPNVIPSINAAANSVCKIGSLLRLKSEWRMFRRPSNTQLRHDKEELIKERKAYGGRKKVKAIWKNKGVYTLKSQGIELEAPILDVVHSDSNKNHIIKKIMTNGSIIQIDGTEFRNRLNDKSADPTDETSSVANDGSEEQSEPQSSNLIDENLSEMVKQGKLLAKITTRPGQDGLCNGYVLEGVELENMLKKLSINQDNAS